MSVVHFDEMGCPARVPCRFTLTGCMDPDAWSVYPYGVSGSGCPVGSLFLGIWNGMPSRCTLIGCPDRDTRSVHPCGVPGLGCPIGLSLRGARIGMACCFTLMGYPDRDARSVYPYWVPGLGCPVDSPLLGSLPGGSVGSLKFAEVLLGRITGVKISFNVAYIEGKPPNTLALTS